MANYTSNPKYQAAFKKAQDLLIQLKGYKGYNNGLEAQLESVAAKSGENSKEFKDLQAKYLKIKQEQEDAQKIVDDFKAKETAIKDAQKKKKEEQKSKSETESKISSIQSQLDVARRRGETDKVAELQSQIDKIKNPSVVTTEAESKQAPDDFKTLLKTSTEFIKKMSGADRKLLAQSLNDSLGANLPVSELVDPASLLAAYNSAITGAQARYKKFGDVLTVDQFLAQKKLENSIIKQGGGSAAPTPWGQIYNPSQAKSAISTAIMDLLGREATDKEISSITKKLTKAQADNPYRKNAQGLTVGGLNAEQFITDIVKAMPEYKSKVQAKQDLTAADIADTARLNGIQLSAGELKSYSDRVKNGEDIKTIEKEIRTAASFGQPDAIKKMMEAGTNLDTIYAPYKRLMGSSLDIDPNTITLDDPTLRMAIGPDKEMSLYDFKKAIRQDNRWKYSQEANDEVTNMINQVKRDFGFMG